MSGFAAAFTSPLIIRAGIKFAHTALSSYVLNGEGQIVISTDGKILIGVKLNLAGGAISLSAKLYMDMSKVASGNVVVLFLADVPDQFRLLTIYGRLKMGFRDANGAPVVIDLGESSAQTVVQMSPGAVLVDPSGEMDVSAINSHTASAQTVAGTTYTNKPYIDVLYNAPPGSNLDYDSILDTDAEFNLLVGGRTITVDGTPVPIVTKVNASGVSETTVLTATSADLNGATAKQGLLKAIKREGVTRYRYFITQANFNFPRGVAEVQFISGAFKNADTTMANGSVVSGMASLADSESFTVNGATATVVNPGAGASVDVREFNERNWVDVDFVAPTSPAGW